ncbi:putative RNA-directed DNA polymerase [Tanacetum coccineum]
MFSMGRIKFSGRNDKSPGLDGFTAAFFKEAWDIMASDVINAVKEFFVNGTLRKELNHRIIALIPKVSSPTRISDYRPISCCNLMHNYHLDRGTPRCAFKVNIQKAYDTVDWDFLKTIDLEHMGSFSIDWCRYGVVPLLFLSVKINVMDLINLCFADDLFLFAHGDVDSARVIMEALDEFKLASEGRLPVKYLGVPLVSSRLLYRGCKELIEKVHNRIKDWRTNLFGCPAMEEDLNLVQSVIGSMHVYWASVFILPTRMLLEIEQLMRGFLWCQGTMRKGKSKVAWEVVYLLSHKESLWVKWIHTYKLRDRSFWDVPLRGNMMWGWRKILQLRPIIREFIWNKVSNGSNVLAWFNKWVVGSPLADTVLVRDMYRAGFDLKTKLSKVIIDNVWRWPTDWLLKYPNIISLPVPMLPRNTVVPWFKVVWFSEAIPRHAFLMWLVIKGKLNMQDKMVWSRIKVLVGLSTASSSIYDIVDQIVPISKQRQVRCIIAKLVISACAYFIWQERNWRLFRLQKRTVAQVIECIKSSVWLKLLSCSFKMSKKAKDMLTLW